MEQLVNQATRGKNVLDLVFTNQPFLFRDCTTSELKPMSDHRLVSFSMDNPVTTSDDDHAQNQEPPPEIATFDFVSANEDALNRELNSTDWRDLLKVTPSHPVTTLQSRLIDGVISAAKRATIPVFCNPSQLQLIA